MRPLAIATLILCLLAVPAGVGLAGTADAYLATARDIRTLRFEIVDIVATGEATGGSGRAFPGPRVTLRVYGVERTALTLAEINFDLEWQGRRMAMAATFPNLQLPRGDALTFTVDTNLEPDRAGEARALLAGGERGFLLVGRARLRLAQDGGGVWLNLRGQLRAAHQRAEAG